MPDNITDAQETRLRRMVGEAHKDDEDRMISDEVIDDLAGEVGLVVDYAGEAPYVTDEDDGTVSANTDYVTTVDIYRVAAEAWRVKAGMVAEGYDFKAEGAEFDRSQVYKHYLDQAARYAGLAGNLTTATNRPVSEDDSTDAFEEWLDT